MSSTKEKETDAALQRSRVYGFLRRIVNNEVDAEFLDWCREQERDGLWSALELDLTETLATTDTSAVVEELAVDYCQLFITSGRFGTPHESVHVKREGAADKAALLWGDPASAVKKLYREAGFEISAEAHRLPDALTVEFEFMERLCQDEAKAGEADRGEEVARLRVFQQRMLREHLGQWLPAYARKLQAAAQTGFYRVLLALAADFIECELECIGEIKSG